MVAPPGLPAPAQPSTNARGVGALLLVLSLPSLLLAGGFALASQTGMRDDTGASLGAALFLALATLWLFTAGLALVRRRPRASLAVPGWLAVTATVIGVLVLLPSSLGNRRISEMVDFAQMFLPLTVCTGLAGAGHLLLARDKVAAGRALNALAPLGAVLALAVLIAKIFRVM